MTSTQFSLTVLKAHILARNVPCAFSEPFLLSQSPTYESERQCIMVDQDISRFDFILSWVIVDTGKWIRHDMAMNEMDNEHMWGDYFMHGQMRNACEEICSWTYEHMKYDKVKSKEQCEHETSSKHQDHWRLCTPCHVEVNLWDTKSTSITQKHCSSTWTPLTTWKYQLCHVKSCHDSSRPHH